MVDATTLNLGRLGALVVSASNHYASSIPQPGDPVDLEVLLPPHRQFGQRCLACEAVAVRSTKDGERWLIALQFERVEIRKVPIQAAATRMVVM